MVNKIAIMVFAASFLIFFPRNLYSETLKEDFSGLSDAIHRADNDISIGDDLAGETVPIPLCVRDLIKRLVNTRYEWLKAKIPREKEQWEKYKNTGEYFGPVFYINAPNGLNLYVFEYRQGGLYDFYLIMFDPLKNKCTENPPILTGRWISHGDMFGVLEKPIVDFVDINGCGTKDLVVQDVMHNGTYSTADVYKYYLIGKNLGLITDLAIQTRADYIDGFQTVRTILEKKRSYLKIGVFHPGQIGTFEVTKSKLDEPYKLLKITVDPKDQKYDKAFMLSNMASETGSDLNRLVTVGY